MELGEEIKKIAEFWIGFEFLKKFREAGNKYIEQILNEVDKEDVNELC